MWLWQPKRDPDMHRPLCTQLSPSGRPLPWCGFSAWNLLVPNPNPNPTPNREPPPNPQPAAISYPAFEPPSGMGPTSALEGDHETGVASALATSLARTLTLAKALPSWGPNSNV